MAKSKVKSSHPVGKAKEGEINKPEGRDNTPTIMGMVFRDERENVVLMRHSIRDGIQVRLVLTPDEVNAICAIATVSDRPPQGKWDPSKPKAKP